MILSGLRKLLVGYSFKKGVVATAMSDFDESVREIQLTHNDYAQTSTQLSQKIEKGIIIDDNLLKRVKKRKEDCDELMFARLKSLNDKRSDAKQQYLVNIDKLIAAIGGDELEIQKKRSAGFLRKDLPQIDSNEQLLDISTKLSETNGVTMCYMKCNALLPTQTAIDRGKVLDRMKAPPSNRIYLISGDNYIVDGHHEWGARLQIDGNSIIPCIKVALPIEDLILWIKQNQNLDSRDFSENTVESGKKYLYQPYMDILKKVVSDIYIKKALDTSKLHKKTVTDKKGKHTTRWVKDQQDDKEKDNKQQEEEQQEEEQQGNDASTFVEKMNKDNTHITQFAQKIKAAKESHLNDFVNDNTQHSTLRKIAQNELDTRKHIESLKSQAQNNGPDAKSKAVQMMIEASKGDLHKNIIDKHDIALDDLNSLSPQQFNQHFNKHAAEHIANQIGGQVHSTIDHSESIGVKSPDLHHFVHKDGKYYDIENTQGVKHPSQLNVFKRNATFEKINGQIKGQELSKAQQVDPIDAPDESIEQIVVNNQNQEDNGQI